MIPMVPALATASTSLAVRQAFRIFFAWIRIERHDEPHGRTRLELLARPYPGRGLAG